MSSSLFKWVSPVIYLFFIEVKEKAHRVTQSFDTLLLRGFELYGQFLRFVPYPLVCEGHYPSYFTGCKSYLKILFFFFFLKVGVLKNCVVDKIIIIIIDGSALQIWRAPGENQPQKFVGPK